MEVNPTGRGMLLVRPGAILAGARRWVRQCRRGLDGDGEGTRSTSEETASWTCNGPIFGPVVWLENMLFYYLTTFPKWNRRCGSCDLIICSASAFRHHPEQCFKFPFSLQTDWQLLARIIGTNFEIYYFSSATALAIIYSWNPGFRLRNDHVLRP